MAANDNANDILAQQLADQAAAEQAAALAAPRDPRGPLAPDAWAQQGLDGAPVARPNEPGVSPYAAGPDMSQGTTSFSRPGAEAPSPDAAPNFTAALAAAQEKIARGQPLTVQDAMILDAAQQQSGAGGGGGGASATSTTVSRVQEANTPELRAARAEGDKLRATMGERAKQVGAKREQEAIDRSYELAARGQAVQDEAAAMQKRQEEQQAQLQTMIARADKQSQDYVKAAQEIDPNRLLKGGKGIMAAFAMAFGASGATLGHSQNFAQQIIQDKVNHDLDAQKTALGAKRDALTHTQQLFQDYRAMYGDDAAARARTTAAVNEAFAMKLQSQAAKLQGTEQKAAALDQRDQLLLQSNALKLEAAQLAARSQVSTTTQFSAGGGAAAGGKPTDVIARMGQYADSVKKYNEQVAGGNAPTTSDETLRNDTAKEVGRWLPVMQQLERLKDLAGKTNAFERGTGASANGRAFQTADDAARQAALQAITGAAFSPEQKKAFEDMVHKRAFTSGQYADNISNMQSFIANEMQAKVAGLHPEHQEQLRKRYIAGRIAPNIVQSMMGGQAPSTTAEQGAAIGGKPVQ